MNTLKSILQWAVPIVTIPITVLLCAKYDGFRGIVIGIILGALVIPAFTGLIFFLWWLYGK